MRKNGFCVRTAYANHGEAASRLASLQRLKTLKPWHYKTKRIYKVQKCHCGMYHITARNGLGTT